MKGERERAMTITIPYDKSIITAEDKGYSATVVCCGDLLDAIAKVINDLELQTKDSHKYPYLLFSRKIDKATPSPQCLFEGLPS